MCPRLENEFGEWRARALGKPRRRLAGRSRARGKVGTAFFPVIDHENHRDAGYDDGQRQLQAVAEQTVLRRVFLVKAAHRSRFRCCLGSAEGFAAG